MLPQKLRLIKQLEDMKDGLGSQIESGGALLNGLSHLNESTQKHLRVDVLRTAVEVGAELVQLALGVKQLVLAPARSSLPVESHCPMRAAPRNSRTRI